MTTRRHCISNTLRRRRSRRPQLFEILPPTLDLTWADIMNDLDPDWHVGGWDTATQEGDRR